MVPFLIPARSIADIDSAGRFLVATVTTVTTLTTRERLDCFVRRDDPAV